MHTNNVHCYIYWVDKEMYNVSSITAPFLILSHPNICVFDCLVFVVLSNVYIHYQWI